MHTIPTDEFPVEWKEAIEQLEEVYNIEIGMTPVILSDDTLTSYRCFTCKKDEETRKFRTVLNVELIQDVNVSDKKKEQRLIAKVVNSLKNELDSYGS